MQTSFTHNGSGMQAVPPHAFFAASAIFHYLGPAFAVLLFRYVDAPGVAWLRITTAAIAFGIWRRPWRTQLRGPAPQWRLLIAMGVILALMNTVFYLAIARLPLGTVGAIEFLAPIALAVTGLQDARNLVALAIAVTGVALLTDVRIGGEPLGYLLAFANCALFLGYIVVGHAFAKDGGTSGIDRIGAAMLIAMVVAVPIGFRDAFPAFHDTHLLLAGIGVGICSSVIPYACDQVAMARLPRHTFALLLAMLPAMACVIGALVLRQIPGPIELAGIGLVIGGVLLHRSRPGT